MSEEVRGSAGIPPRPADMTVMEVWCLCWIAGPLLPTEMSFVVATGAPPPHPGQRENARLHFLPQRLGHRHRQARV